MYKSKKIYVAPMMQYTDKHDRYFLRLISKNVILFTEMIPSNAIIYGNQKKLLEYNTREHPIILQVGGSNPIELAKCAKIAKTLFNYDEININIGCPSKKVENGMFGACLMNKPFLVGKCVKEIKKNSKIPISIKCRIGLGEKQNYSFLKTESIFGNTSTEVARIEIAISFDITVFSGFTSIKMAPFCFAYTGNVFTGETTNDVPTITITSHTLASLIALCQISCGKDSPNQTTSGLSILPHLHLGGSDSKFSVMLSVKLQIVHLIRIILP